MTLYILSQVSVAIGICFDLGGKLFRQKKYLLLCMTLASIFFVLSYVFLQSPLPAITNGLHFVKGVLYLLYDKKQKPYWVYLVTIFAVLASFIPFLIIFWTSAFDLFMLFSLIIVLLVLSQKNTLIIRIGLIVNSCMWATYNLFLKGYVNMACDIVTILILIYAIIRFNVIEPKKLASTKNEN